MSDNIYRDMSTEDIDALKELINGRVRSMVSISNRTINNYRYWTAIFAPYLTKVDKQLLIMSSRYYYKQSDLDRHYPTNPNSSYICPPFDRTAAPADYEIRFIDTSTGAKIYEYATALCKSNKGYTDKQSLAVSLTKSKTHKVKVVQSNSTVWILSNDIDEQLVQNTVALFPFLFSIQELLGDNHIINCCKAVTKDEPIKQYFQGLFDSLAEIREQKKINIIKKALNTKLSEAIENINRNITSMQHTIQDNEERLIEQYRRLDEYIAQKLGYESKKLAKDEDVTEVMDFINRNKYIQGLHILKSLYNNNTEYLQLEVHAPITIYEIEPLERQLNNLINGIDATELRTKILKAFERIFIKEEFQMICETFVKIDVHNSTVDASKDANRKQYSDYQKLPQPHLTRFNCWGDNKYVISKYFNDSDLIGVINSVVIAAQNINFTDTTVLKNWLEAISYNSHLYELPTCLSKTDNKMWSIKDIVEQIEKENEANNEEEIGHPELTDEIPNF